MTAQWLSRSVSIFLSWKLSYCSDVWELDYLAFVLDGVVFALVLLQHAARSGGGN